MRDFAALGNKDLEFVSAYGLAICHVTTCMGTVGHREYAKNSERQFIQAGNLSVGYQV